MEQKIHSHKIILDWHMLNAINKVDKFDAKWEAIEKKEAQSLNQLKALSVVKSVGASARMRGAYMNDIDVEELLQKKNKFVLQDDYSKEAVGYYEVMTQVLESYDKLELIEFNIKEFHKVLLRYSEDDHWKRGSYKLGSKATKNQHETSQNKGLMRTTVPTFFIEKLMNDLLGWYHQDSPVHPLVKCAVFTYYFLDIKPFEKGSDRLSRLITVFMLLKCNYNWMKYVSLEQGIEIRETAYLRILRQCQSEESNKNISAWVLFFLEVLADLQSQLMQKLKTAGTVSKLPPKYKSVLLYIETHPGCKSGYVATNLGMANSTTKRMLKELVDKNLIERYGNGAGTNYTVS